MIRNYHEFVVCLLDGFLPALNISHLIVEILVGNRKLLRRKEVGKNKSVNQNLT